MNTKTPEGIQQQRMFSTEHSQQGSHSPAGPSQQGQTFPDPPGQMSAGTNETYPENPKKIVRGYN